MDDQSDRDTPDRLAARRPPPDTKAVLVGLGVLLLCVGIVLGVATVVVWWWRTVIG